MTAHPRWTLARRALLGAIATLCVVATSCADIRFEKSPYAPRGLDVVYSEQEDVTFLAWRLRQGADPRRVSFELYQDGDWRPIDLERAPFPAEPYECEQHYLCFQYQVPGRYDASVVARPLRAIHDEEGLYAGGLPREQVVGQTFGVDPIALGRNDRIDPARQDWFADQGVPLRRDYQWQLVDSSRPDYLGGRPEQCDSPAGAAWAGMGEHVEPDPSWVEAPKCLAARPARRDAPGVVALAPLPPSAELVSEQQDYLPPEERPPIIYAYMLDLLIKSQTRCQRARETIIGRIDRSFGERAPGAVRLGTFTPLDPETGRPLSGCDQRADQDYPVSQLLDSLRQAAAELAPRRVRFVLVYLNNVELPPSNRVLLQLQMLALRLDRIDNITPYGMAVGSNVAANLLPWDQTIGWRPIDDETFVGDLRDWGEYTLPFRTQDHDEQTEVRLNLPVGARDPRHFKLCSVTPQQLLGIGLEPGQTSLPPGLITYPWPESGVPHYTIALLPQVLVPFESYSRQQVSVVLEVCERFCEMPFRKVSRRAGLTEDYDSWLETRECQWGG